MFHSQLVVMFDRVGLILNFLSFWLAAPEILGEDRLRIIVKVFEDSAKGITRFVNFLIFIVVLMVVASCFLFALIYILSSTIDKSVISWIGGAITIIIFLGTAFLLADGLDRLNELTEGVFKRLADDSKIRQRSLVVGAILFVLGNILQLLATL